MPINVLVVEDDEADREIVRHSLKSYWGDSYEIEETQTIAEAQERLTRPGIDAVVLDLGLPDARGFDGLTRLTKFEPPVIVLTGQSEEDSGSDSLRHGAADYLNKMAVTPQMLERTLRYAVIRHNHRTGNQQAPPVAVLHVEDDPGDQELVREMLNRISPSSHNLTTSSTVRDSMGHLDKSHIILVDLNLPDSQGIDTVDAMVRHAPHANKIVVTGVDDFDLAQKALRAGADDYLIKGSLMPEQVQRALTFAIASRAWETHSPHFSF